MTTLLPYLERPGYLADETCKIALVGFGTVGSSVARLLYARGEEHSLRLTHICNRRVARKKVDWIPPDVTWTENIEDVLAADVDVVVELMGGLEPAHEWVLLALQSGKSVVSANKQLIAHSGSELLRIAARHGQSLSFGACVAGGVPVLSGLRDGLAGDRLTKVCGILNGTCNYILTRIEQAGTSFAEALVEAQRAGFAEADPTDDVDGLDAGAKLVILARVGLNLELRPEQVVCRSIQDVTALDFGYAHDLGCTIRQISTASISDGESHAVVEPSLVPKESPLAQVSGSQNLVVSSGEFGGDIAFSGAGAGGNPTAVAVISDLLYLAQHRPNGLSASRRPAAISHEITNDRELPQYVRFVVRDRPGIIAALASVFCRHHINIDAVFQRPGHAKSELPFVITLESCRESRASAALAEIADFDFLAEAPVRMPILK
ncbi:MAG: homoserine dehydrogenase [Candidatus Korobacteraceae bacterium]